MTFHRLLSQALKAPLRTSLLMAALLVFAGVAHAQADVPGSTKDDTLDKVVYHLDDSAKQATKALRNMRNHLDVAPKTQIIVVAHAEGIDFLMEGARDDRNAGIDYASLVSALTARGVEFEICEITLRSRNLKREQFVMDAGFTPSGVARITELQQHEGFAYLKP